MVFISSQYGVCTVLSRKEEKKPRRAALASVIPIRLGAMEVAEVFPNIQALPQNLQSAIFNLQSGRGNEEASSRGLTSHIPFAPSCTSVLPHGATTLRVESESLRPSESRSSRGLNLNSLSDA